MADFILNVQILSEVDDQFYTTWDKLWKKSHQAHFFNSPHWLLICLKTYPDKKYKIYIFKREEQIVAIFPLEEIKKFGVKTLTSPGGNFTDKSTLLLTDTSPEVIKQTMQILSRQGNLALNEVSREVAQICSQVDNFRVKMSTLCPYLPLNPDPLRYLSKRAKREIRKVQRTEGENIYFKQYRQNLLNKLEIAFEVSERSAKRARGKDIFTRPEVKQLFKNIVRYAKEFTVINILYHRDTAISFDIGFEYKKTYLAFHTGYDLKYKKMVPGKYLIYHLLNSLHQHEVEVFDHSRGISDLKKQFSPFWNEQYTVYYSVRPFVARQWLLADKFSESLKNNKYLYIPYTQFRRHFHSVLNSLLGLIN